MADAARRLAPDDADPTKLPLEQLHAFPIGGFMRGMTVRLQAEESLQTERTIGFEFTDIGRHWTLAVGRGVAEVREGRAEQADARLALSAERWKAIAAGAPRPVLLDQADGRADRRRAGRRDRACADRGDAVDLGARGARARLRRAGGRAWAGRRARTPRPS
jgi:hypothetical protein